MISRPVLCAATALLLLPGCGVPVAVVAGALGVSAAALRVDEKLLDLWLLSREETRAPAPKAP